MLGGLLGAGMAMIFLFWALIIKIAQECNVDKKDPIITFSILMIVLCSMNAGSIFPFHAGYLIYAGFLGTPIPTVPSLLYGTLAFLLTPLAFFFVAKVIFRLDASKFVLSDVMVAELESKRSTKGERITLYVLLAYIALLLLPEFIPNAPGMAMLKTIGVCGMSAIGLLVLNFIRVEGKPLINLTQTFVRQTQWPLILLLAVTFPLADAMKNPDSGIMATISTTLTPLVSGYGLIPFMILSIILVGCLTQITHNIVLGAMFIPVLCPLCEQLGGNAFVLWYMLYVTLNCAFVTPAASMQSAMVHGHEAVTKKYAYIFGIMVLVLNWIILTLLIPVGASLFS